MNWIGFSLVSLGIGLVLYLSKGSVKLVDSIPAAAPFTSHHTIESRPHELNQAVSASSVSISLKTPQQDSEKNNRNNSQVEFDGIAGKAMMATRGKIELPMTENGMENFPAQFDGIAGIRMESNDETELARKKPAVVQGTLPRVIHSQESQETQRQDYSPREYDEIEKQPLYN